MAPQTIASKATCDHCNEEVVFLPVVWGAERPRWPYSPEQVPTDTVHPSQRYAYSQSRGGVVALDPEEPADSPKLPRKVLVPHRCGRSQHVGQFTRWMSEQIDQQAPGLGDPLMGWIKDGPPSDRPAPPPPRGPGFRRGLGKKST